MDEIVNVVEHNQDLEKLALQHNRFGEGDLSQLADVISTHKSLKYLDISANRVCNNNFIWLFKAIKSDTAKISTFHCRKNRIGGVQIEPVLRCQSLTLSVLDLSQNILTEANSTILLDYAKKNVVIEQIHLDKNMAVNA